MAPDVKVSPEVQTAASRGLLRYSVTDHDMTNATSDYSKIRTAQAGRPVRRKPTKGAFGKARA